ncbi:hypothetical protein ACSER5_27330, partial [Pseudomonas aeruginosa]
VRMSVEQVSGSAWAECPNGVESADSQLPRQDFFTYAAYSKKKRIRKSSLERFLIEPKRDKAKAERGQDKDVRQSLFGRVIYTRGLPQKPVHIQNGKSVGSMVDEPDVIETIALNAI